MTNFQLPDNPIIGWIGTGVMGNSMFRHILDKGYKGFVYTRTKAKASSLLEQGAVWCNSPGEVAQKANVVFTMVGFPADVREIYLAPVAIIESATPYSVLVDMSTTNPSLAVEIYNMALARHVYAIDAPVSGGDIGAQKATLSIMAGGDKPVFDALEPLFSIMGRKIVYQGKTGSGQHTKMCNQIQIAGTMIGMCESLLYGYKAGLELETMLHSISGGAAACWSLDNLAPRILQRDFEPGFFVRHFIKDMGIALEEARRMELSLPGLALAEQLYQSVSALGYAEKGTQALMVALENMANVKR
jgi:3-hydroxyisobutyrate dehydrogenase